MASGVVVPSAAAIAAALELSRARLEPLRSAWRGIAIGAQLAALAYATALVHGGAGRALRPLGRLAPLRPDGGLRGVPRGPLGRRGRRGRAQAQAAAARVRAPRPRGAGRGDRRERRPVLRVADGLRVRPVLRLLQRRALRHRRRHQDRALHVPVVGARDAGGGLLLAAGLGRAPSGALSREPVRGAPLRAVRLGAGLLLLAASGLASAEGARLGHWQTASSIASTLGARASGPRCDVVYPDSLLAPEAAMLVRDCEEELGADERRLGTRLDGRLTAFVFHDADQKRRLMGAANTSIAKPWRREVYIQLSGYPHPVLGHENRARRRGRARSPEGRSVSPAASAGSGRTRASSKERHGGGDVAGRRRADRWAVGARDARPRRILPPIRRLFSLDFMAGELGQGVHRRRRVRRLGARPLPGPRCSARGTAEAPSRR